MCDQEHGFSERDADSGSDFNPGSDSSPANDSRLNDHLFNDRDTNPMLPNQMQSSQMQSSHLKTGWVIEGRRVEDGQPTGRFLQIGTGQWCPQQYATIFPLRKTAAVYAHEFGYSVGYSVSVVRFFPIE